MSCILDLPPRYNFFVSQKQYIIKRNKSVLSKIAFNLDDDDSKTVDFYAETLTFTLVLLKK